MDEFLQEFYRKTAAILRPANPPGVVEFMLSLRSRNALRAIGIGDPTRLVGTDRAGLLALGLPDPVVEEVEDSLRCWEEEKRSREMDVIARMTAAKDRAGEPSVWLALVEGLSLIRELIDDRDRRREFDDQVDARSDPFPDDPPCPDE